MNDYVNLTGFTPPRLVLLQVRAIFFPPTPRLLRLLTILRPPVAVVAANFCANEGKRLNQCSLNIFERSAHIHALTTTTLANQTTTSLANQTTTTLANQTTTHFPSPMVIILKSFVRRRIRHLPRRILHR